MLEIRGRKRTSFVTEFEGRDGKGKRSIVTPCSSEDRKQVAVLFSVLFGGPELKLGGREGKGRERR